MSDCFTVTIEDKIAHIVLSRPEKRNAMKAEFWDDLPEIVEDIDGNSKARVIIISAQGPVFSAGIDLSMFGNISGGINDKNNPSYGLSFYDTVHHLQNTFSALENCRIPVIAAINGGCIGGAVDLITACDIRLATNEAFISIYEIVIGMTADVGTFPRILNHLPEGVVRELAYTGRKMGAEEAERRGLFNSVYGDEKLMMAAAMEMAKEIASRPPSAVYGSKRIITYSRDHSTKDALDQIGVWNMSMLNPTEMMEAMAAKAQKRPGNFPDLPKKRKKMT